MFSSEIKLDYPLRKMLFPCPNSDVMYLLKDEKQLMTRSNPDRIIRVLNNVGQSLRGVKDFQVSGDYLIQLSQDNDLVLSEKDNPKEVKDRVDLTKKKEFKAGFGCTFYISGQTVLVQVSETDFEHYEINEEMKLNLRGVLSLEKNETLPAAIINLNETCSLVGISTSEVSIKPGKEDLTKIQEILAKEKIPKLQIKSIYPLHSSEKKVVC